GVAVVHPEERGVRRGDGAVIVVPAHDAVGETRREGRVRRDGGAVDGEARLPEPAGDLALLLGEAGPRALEVREAREHGGGERDGWVIGGERAGVERGGGALGRTQGRAREDGFGGVLGRAAGEERAGEAGLQVALDLAELAREVAPID